MTLLAKTAEGLYWAGRYFERAEDLARVIEVHGDSHFDMPVGEDVGWRPLLVIAGAESAFATRLDAQRSHPSETLEARIVRFLLTDHDNPSSILASLTSGRQNLRTARQVVPREVWQVCNDLWMGVHPGRPDAYPLDGSGRDGRVATLRRVIDECQRLNGVIRGTMRRDEALAFVQIGQNLERIDVTARVLGARADSILAASSDAPYSEVRRIAVLRGLAAYQPFRRAMPMVADTGSALRFVLQDDRFPRAVAACLGEILDLLKTLPSNDEAVAIAMDMKVTVSDAAADRMSASDLKEFMGTILNGLVALDDKIDSTYFRPVHRGVLSEEGRAATRTVTSVPRISSSALDGPTRTYRVRHETVYDYSAPAEQSYNEAHLHPRETNSQHCLSHSLAVDPPPSTCSEVGDLFGNTMTCFVVRGGFEHLAVTSISEVVVVAPPKPPATSRWETARRVLESDRMPESREARRFRSPSRLVPTAASLAEYAYRSFTPDRPLVEATIDLCRRIHEEFVYDPGFTSVTTPLLEVFECRRGVCQDFAHLMIGCLRSIGLAARYVSGYLETAPPDNGERLIGADASHAWPSVFIPGWGWLDVDPTNDQLVGETYVTLGWGRDYWDVSPLRGSVEGGGESHTMTVKVDVRLVGELAHHQ